MNPQAEIIIYVYTPLPPSSVPDAQRLKLTPLRDLQGEPITVSAQRGRVDRAALGRLRLSRRRALDR